jgi:ribosomal protein S18 acetylase RimI-like enzyme
MIQPGAMLLMNVRNATKQDAEHLAFLINLAGEDLPKLLWRRMADAGQEPLAFGALRAVREDGAFSYRNARILEIDGSVAGMLLSYLLPDPHDAGDLDDYPAVIRPLVELEAKAPGTWYINAIATYQQFRGRGVASALMSLGEHMARDAHASGLSLIVASENKMAHGLYVKLGYQEIESRSLVAFPGGPAGGEWLLMVKNLN